MKKVILSSAFLLFIYYLSAQPNIYAEGKIAVNNDTPVADLDIYSKNPDAGVIVSSALGENLSFLQLLTTRPDPTKRLNGSTAGSGNKGWMVDAVHDDNSAVTQRSLFRISYFNDQNWITPFEISPSGLSSFRYEAHARGGMRINGHAHFFSNGATSDNWITSYDENSSRRWIINMLDSSDGDAFRIYSDAAGRYVWTIRPDGNTELTGKLTVFGSDYAERFYVTPTATKATIQPGMLVSIDERARGKLKVTNQSYDTQVAGVISGANGVQTAMVLGQEGTLADGDTPVAVAGRVYVYADATKHSINTGDLLTSSHLAGHVMKVTKKKKAIGAIVGKALEPLQEGTGLILVLVNGQ